MLKIITRRVSVVAGVALQSENLRGILLVVARMASFTFADLFLTLSTESLPTGEVTMAFGIGCAIGFYVILGRGVGVV